MKNIYRSISLLVFTLSGISLSAQTTFSYTGAVQTYVVPACVTEVTISALGAQGGGAQGGLGGQAVATVPVTPGSTLYVYVGGRPTAQLGPGGFNGGGATLALPCGGGGDGFPGGGASDVRTSPSLNDRMVVAGGGGGEGWSAGIGGAGGGLSGSDGAPSWIAGTHGKGGTQSAGGIGGFYTGNSQSAGAGGFGYGGDAGPPNTYCTGGAGGGGYYGGGGGYVSAGAGGSSYISFPGSTATATTAGIRAGNGQIIITPGSSGSVPTAPTAISGSLNICEGTSDVFSISSVVGATSYTWSVSPGATITSGQGTTAISVAFTNVSGTISVTADNVCGSSPVTTFTYTIVLSPAVTATSTTSQVCLGGSVTLNGGGAVSYTWSGGVTDGLAFAPPMTDTYTVTGTDPTGCTNTATVSVTVNALPAVSAQTTSTEVCEGSSVTLTGNGASSYTWSGGVTDAVPFSPVATDTYTVTGTDGNGCMDTATTTVIVNPLPTVTATPGTTLACLDDAAVSLTGSPVGGTWSGPGVVAGPAFMPSAAGQGTHTVTYSFTDANGCSDTANANITVDFCLGTIESPLVNNTSVFPNPNAGSFTVAVNANVGDMLIEIVDMQGRVVYSSSEQNVQAGFTKQVSMENAAAGIYLMRVTTSEGQQVEKISVQK